MDRENGNDVKYIGKRNFLLGIAAGVIIILVLNFTLGTFLPSSGLSDPNRDEPPYSSQGKTPAQSNENSTIDKKMEEIFGILDTYYVGEYDKEQLLENMYLGMVYGVGDPYTSYMDKETFAQYISSIDGEYTGIGVVVTNDLETNSIVVVTPFEGYPGQKAGMLPGDRIIKVDGTDVYGDTLDEALNLIKGEPLTTVNITVYRPSTGTTTEYKLVREKINVPTVSHKMMDGDIGYIRITQFDKVTLDQFREAYNELTGNNMKGLIIDLRNNPGGLLSVVVGITDMLVPKATIVYTEDKNGKREYYNSNDEHIDVPLLVLVNGGSASASEVLSGAVQDLGVGELVGTTTFGKGLVQNIYECSDGSAVKVTIAKYYTPNGICIHGVGLKPDYEIDMSDELSVQISSLTLDEDVQMKKAVEVMTEKIGE